MKRFLLSAMSAAVLLSCAVPARAAVQTFIIDPGHTSATWSVGHMGFSTFTGKLPNITGTLMLDEEKPENSKIDVKIDTNAVLSGVVKLDEHLKGGDFFNVAKFPAATFVSDKVEVTGKDTAKVTGTLTLLGVSKPVTLDVKLNKVGEHPMMKKKWVGFDATATVKRSEFGMNYGVPNVSDEVKLQIEAEAGIATMER